MRHLAGGTRRVAGVSRVGPRHRLDLAGPPEPRYLLVYELLESCIADAPPPRQQSSGGVGVPDEVSLRHLVPSSLLRTAEYAAFVDSAADGAARANATCAAICRAKETLAASLELARARALAADAREEAELERLIAEAHEGLAELQRDNRALCAQLRASRSARAAIAATPRQT